MNKIHSYICPICGSKEFVPHLRCKDNYATGEFFQLEKCSDCGFVLTQDFPSDIAIGKYYDVPDYISHSDTNKGIINKLYHIARKIALKSKSRIILKYSKLDEGMLLDIGCGTGYFLNRMKELKWVVTGIEKAEGARKYAKERFDLNTQETDYLFQISAKSKDVVTMWHVLEHIENLNETVEALHYVLKDEGVAFIALPNKESYDAKSYKDNWAAYDVPRHLWHFSPSDFELLANKHNFSIIGIKPMYFDIFYISMLSEKYKGTFMAQAIGLMKGGIYFLTSLFNKRKCSSLIYIIKKKQ